jgi:S1-C subfamily serine protease
MRVGTGSRTVTPKAVLYEETPADPNGSRFVGSVIWHTETVTPGPGQPPELAIRADVEVPERKLTWSLRRNTDKSLPASHTVETIFKIPADFPSGGIANVPGILMKQAEQTRGVPLAGLSVKVTTGFFLIGLSSVPAEKERNLQLLKDRAWFDIPINYNNGRRAILAIEKGNPGERAFAEAFKAWELPAPSSSFGTGFFVFLPGYILTNQHVVDGCRTATVSRPGYPISDARIVGTDSTNDLALLMTNMGTKMVPPFRIGARVGENIFVYGFPLAGLLSSSGNFTVGNITSVAGLGDDSRIMQISAPVQPGNSGGPLLDKFGNVVGIVVSKLNAMRLAQVTQDMAQNVNFALKASIAANFLEVNNISTRAGSNAEALEVTEIAERAKQFTVQVTCKPGR